MELSHLRPETCPIAELPAQERLERMNMDRWISYTRANLAVATLEQLMRVEPGKIRPRNMLLVGATNNGKTMIAEKFLRQHPQRSSDDGEHEIIPVLAVQMPAEPTPARLFSSLMMAMGIPSGGFNRAEHKEAFALGIMRKVQTRLIIIDELHNLLGASARRQRELLNLLRYIGNELRIPLACLGTRDAYLAIRSDDQLENRFHPYPLPRWSDDEELGRLLSSVETILPLREPSHLGAPEMRSLILRRSEGTIGEIASLLTEAASVALQSGWERIDTAAVMEAAYQPPTVRRRSVERSVMS
ncbi:TniB family NTP-binding protein [Agrobacterium sp. LAD9]|uniref:TniB family NTP-binding protein n=1 Tax=Agrobacterium sp. LAD9 TaxID=2055153 RepID=UPI001FCF1B1C|nr:TniB family NTP-binding protein [Agrobacterium sp. LAD9]